MSEGELFHGLAEGKLRQRCLVGGVALLLSVVLPYEVIAGRPQFLWSLFAELPPSAIVASLSLPLAGLSLLLARKFIRRGASLAVAVIAALLASVVCHKLGSDAAAWGLLPLPASFTGRAGSALLALASVAAGAELARRQVTRRPARAALVLATAATLTFYFWPARGEVPGVLIAHRLAALPDLPTLSLQVGALTIVCVALWPLVMTLLGWLQLRGEPKPRTTPPVLGMAALFGFPLMLTMLLFSVYLRNSPGAAMFAALGAAVEITAVIVLLAAALEMLGHALGSDEDVPLPRGWGLPRAAAVAAGSVALVAAAQWLLARPPDKGIDWQLGAQTEAGDRLYGELMVAWANARWRWDLEVRRDSSASALVEVKDRGRQLLEGAEQVDPQLRSALAELVKGGTRLDTSARHWYQLVAAVNAAARRKQLPYYLDPRVSIAKTKEGLRRRFLLDSYRVDRVQRYLVDGEHYAMLQVHSLGTRRGSHQPGLLGFSRDLQPFALVVLDSTEQHLLELEELVALDPPRCGTSFTADRDEAMHHCGRFLRPFLKTDQAAVAVWALVERHELQHQIDGPLLALAPPVLTKLAGHRDETKERVNRELSAYVASLADDRPGNKLGLVVPYRFALLHQRGVYHHAGVLMFEALAGRNLRVRGEPDPRMFMEAFDELVALDDASLRQRAAAAWEGLFGASLPPVQRLTE